MPYIPAGPLRMGIFPITERSGLHWSRVSRLIYGALTAEALSWGGGIFFFASGPRRYLIVNRFYSRGSPRRPWLLE